MTTEEVYNKGYSDGEHDGYFSQIIEDGIEEKMYNPPQDPLEVEAAKLQEAYNKGFEDGRRIKDMNPLNKIFIKGLYNLRSKLEYGYESLNHEPYGDDVKMMMDCEELTSLIAAVDLYIHVLNESGDK